MLAYATPVLLLAAVLAQARAGRATWQVGGVAAAVGYGAMLAWLVAPAGFVAWVGLTAIQVAWWSLLTWLLGRWIDRPALPVVAALLWVGIDAWRGTFLLGGFGWGTLAAAQVDNAWILPLARLAGEEAITLAVVLIGALAFTALRGPVEAAWRAERRIDVMTIRDHLGAGRFAALGLAGAMLLVTLATVEPPAASGTADVLVVQGNDMEQPVGTGLEIDERIATQMLAETREAIGDGPTPDLVAWPESSIDRDPAHSEVLREVLLEAGRLTDGSLITGINLDGSQPSTFYNSAVHIGRDGSVQDEYRKRHLVPFGEYVPWREYLDWFPALDQVPRDGVPGEEPGVLAIDGIRAAVAICFETMFSYVVDSNVLAEPQPAQVILALTNDSSFLPSGEAMQHLAQSRLRAIETGRWVIHGSISGRSSIIDPDGRLHGLTDVFEVDHLRQEVDLVHGLTPYLRTGDWLDPLSRAAVVALVLAAGVTFIRRRKDAS